MTTSTPLDRLGLLASAIAGVTVSVAVTEAGEGSWTDGSVVHLDPSLTADERLGAVAVQASLLAAGSLDPEILGRLDRRGAIAARYLAVEGHRALAVNDRLLPPAARRLADRSVASRSSSAQDSMALAKGREPLPVAPAIFGAIRPRRLRARRRPGDDAEPATQLVHQSREQVQRELDDGEDAERAGAFELFDPVGGGGAIGRLLQRLLGNSRGRGEGDPGVQAATHRTATGGGASRGRARSTRGEETRDDLEVVRRTAASYPEWNVFTRSYRPDWCAVTEVEPPSADAATGADHEARALRRSLSRLGLDLERRRRQLQGDDIDLDAAIEARVELAARSVPDEAVYVDRTRTRRELSVLVLLDTSGSAGEPSGAGGTVFDHQRAAAAALTQALHDLGDRVALYGFSSQGRHAVQITVVKRFIDRYDARTRRRLHGLVPGAYTRLGAAIRHGSSVLEDQGGTARRLLVVVSDGFAYDHGYEGAYAEADARRALAEARRRGTACLCLSIGADTEVAALRRVFGSAAFASFPRSDQLATVAGPMFGPAIRFAASQRRVWQRNERTRERLIVDRRPA